MDINNYTPKYAGLSGRSFLNLKDISPEEIYEILYTARLLKMKQHVGERQTQLLGKEVLLIAKTAFSGMRIAFEIAVKQLCGTSIVLPLGGTQIEALVENVDFLPSIARYGVDGIAINTDDWRDAEALKAHSPVPVINAHGAIGPCVALAALLTCWEKFGRLKDLNLSIIGNMSAHNFMMQAAVKCGMKVNTVSPKELAPPEELVASSEIYGVIKVFDEITDGLNNANAVFVIGGEMLGEEYKLTENLMELTAPDSIFLHPMPVDRVKEVDAEVCDGPQSAMLDMAENLLHVEKAVLALTLGKPINI